MKIAYQDDLVTLYHGDAREIVPTLADCSVDLVLTDPPYGINFNDGDLASNIELALGRVKSGKALPGDPRTILNDGKNEANELVRWLFAESKRLLPSATDHPTPKPVELMEIFIRNHTAPGDLVLDPFCGGGTTLVAARLMGRKAIGVEIDERWCNLSIDMLRQKVLPLGW